MESDAYALGHLDAVIAFGGTKEAWARAIAPLMGAAAGAMLAPEGEGWQGAALGGLGALGAQSAVLSGGRKVVDLFRTRPKAAMDVSTSVGIPGTSLGIGMKDQRERLPGMAHWVPRSTMERGFEYADQGLDAQAVAQLEGDRGSLSSPLLGAALAAGGALKFLPQSGAMGPILSGLAGAGAGTLYHKALRGHRISEGLEAFGGAQREREKFPLRRHGIQTANESTPLAVSRGQGDA